MKRFNVPMWCRLLTKRLYKKATFVIILLLIPLVVFGYSFIDTDDSGVITVALACEQPKDAVTDAVIEGLMADGQLIRYVTYDNPAQAEEAVRAGRCDAAWIFVGNLQEAVRRYGENPNDPITLVEVYEQEDNIALMLSREQLEGKLYEQYAPYVYLHHVRENLSEAAEWSDEEILAYYNNTTMDNEALFAFSQVDIGGMKEGATELHYLMTPVRGLLGVIILLCGLASSMYYIIDFRRGTFSWMPEHRRVFAELGCEAVAMVQVAAVSLVSLSLAGLAVSLWRELLIAVLCSLATAVFCMLLRRVCGSLRALGTLLPLLVVITFVVCPVFFDLKEFRFVQYLFPPSYYITAAYNDFWLLMIPVYTLVCAVLYWLVGKITKRL